MGLSQLIITFVVIAVIFSKVDAEFQHIGCFKDVDGDRALPQKLGDFSGTKDTAIQQCADLAQKKGYTTFALQYGGECWSGASAYQTYDKHGASTGCGGEYGEGLGGNWVSDVYFLKPEHLGCFKDVDGDRALPQNLGYFSGTKDTAIQKCANLAQQKGYTTFGLQYGGECWSGYTAYETYDKHGASTGCGGEYGEGLGGNWVNDVYFLKPEHLGCFKDVDGDRALPQNLGYFSGTKDTAIQKCANLAQQEGYTTIGLQYGGECWSGASAYETYDKHGASTGCGGEYGEGLGGNWVNDVYRLPDDGRDFAAAHIPQLRFDGGAENNCFPDEATDSNNNHCRAFNSNAPIYYAVRDCGDYRKLVWWIWYGYQTNCDCCSGSHDNDWEHITINFIKDGSSWRQDSVTWFQHDGWYTRSNEEEHPKIYVGKSAHGSYDNWCDGKGASWQQDYCPGGCGYWNDYRNDEKTSPWIPHNIKPVTAVTGQVANRVKDEKYFHDTELNKCAGGNWRCVKGPCGCWRNDHTFPAPQCDL